MKKIGYIAAALLLLLGLLGAGTLIRQRQYQDAHVFVEDAVYPADAQSLDLRGTEISIEHYESLRQQLPDCTILWDVPFQGGFLSSDTQDLTVTELTDADVELLLAYFPELVRVDARGCQDYAQLQALQAGKPDCQVLYEVYLSGTAYAMDTTALTFTQADGGELLENLQYLPQLEQVYFDRPSMEASQLLALRERYPQISFTWEQEVLGTLYPDDITELDFSGTVLEGVEELESQLAYFPDLEKLILCDCGLDNETLAAYRERVRADYKVVWSVQVGELTVRTDETTFMPVREDSYVRDSVMADLYYCEDMIVVDVGHMAVSNLDWLYGMPNLQYLILADTNVKDLTAVGTLKELIYLELFLSPGITDYSPLLGCTALEDLNLSLTYGDTSVLAQMTWLKHLWANSCGLSEEEKELLRSSLTGTVLVLDGGWQLGGGWRDLDNYYAMRDLLGMYYADWGSERMTGSAS